MAKVKEFLGERWVSFKTRWSSTGWFGKFVLINVAYPWIPTIAYVSTKVNPPDEVKILVKENGDIVVEAAGTAWQLACFFFVNLFS